jgi:hypothetical protein
MFGLLQGLLNIKRQKNANKALDQLLGQDTTYTQNPYASTQLATAQNLYNGRMAGAPQLERNIFANEANENAAVDKSATSGSQALAAKLMAGGQAGQNLQDLQLREQQNKYQMLQNLNEAYGGMIREGDKAYQDRIRRFGDLASIRGMQQQNKTNALNGVFNGLNSDVNDALSIFGISKGSGGFGNLFKSGGMGMSSGIGTNSGQYSYNPAYGGM